MKNRNIKIVNVNHPEYKKAKLALSTEDRYKYFIEEICLEEEVWGLHKEEGWALTEDKNQDIFLVWSNKEYAELYKIGKMTGYEVKSFTLNSFLEELLPDLQKNNTKIGAFYTCDDKGAVVDADQVLKDSIKELKDYE